MRRAAFERTRTVRVWRRHLQIIHPGPETPLCICEHQPGRFRKGQKVGGCGRPRCWLCKHEKLLKIPRRPQLRSDVSYHEWRRELGLAGPGVKLRHEG